MVLFLWCWRSNPVPNTQGTCSATKPGPDDVFLHTSILDDLGLIFSLPSQLRGISIFFSFFSCHTALAGVSPTSFIQS